MVTTDGDTTSNDEVDRPKGLERKASATFAGVAHQVVTSKRAAKGFISMWAKDSTSVTHVHKGIHMEKKKIDLKTVASEYKEIKRRQFYQELIVYLIFLTLFFTTLSWLPVQDSYEQNDVVGSLTCREQGLCELKKFGDIYEFAASLTDHICDRKEVTSQWVRLGGLRFRQVRVKEQQCMVHNGWYTPCYPFYSEDTEEKAPLQGQEGRVYTWKDGLGPMQPELYQSVFEVFSPIESFGNGGYAVDLCRVRVDDLQEDDWLSVSTRALAIEFALVNPVTRVFTIGLHVFTMNPSGHMEHFPHSSHLRIVGLEENELLQNATDVAAAADMVRPAYYNVYGWAKLVLPMVFDTFDHRILLWLGLIAFLITYSIGEATEMSTMGARTYLKSDMWNIFELTHLVVLGSFIIYMARFYFASSTYASDLTVLMSGQPVEGVDHSNMHVLLRNFQRLSDLASLASAVSLLKVFKFLRMNSTLNLLWRVLGMAMRDLMGFLVIFNLIFLGYSAMGSYAFGFALEEFSTIGKSYGSCFQMLAGEMDYARLSQANPRVAPVFIGTFVVLVFQILVNMFVAILSEYYESAKNDDGSGEDVEYDVLTRVRNYLRACSPTVVANKNEVIRLIPKQQVRLISTNLVDQEETRQRAKKLFRGAVWRVVALLRFGMKFDRRINFGDRKNHTTHTVTRDKMVTHIRLSENFDHKTIKEMIPIGITIRLKGDSLLGDGLALKVIRHNNLSVECVVLDSDEGGSSSSRRSLRKPLSLRSLSAESFDESDFDADTQAPRERILELLGGEKLRIPWQIFAFHVLRSFLKELRMGLQRAIKLWNYSKSQLVDDYHLGLLFESVRADGRSSLRYDEVYRMLDLYLRKDKRKRLCTQAEVRHEALEVMYRFRKCLIDMPSREKEGHNYRPKPVDTSTVELGPLEYLGDMLARNCHDMWALERLKQGWQYGPERSDSKKRHPNLIPYKLLSVEEQAFDYRSSLETLKTIVFMNYTIVRLNNSGSFQDTLSRSASMMSDDGYGSTAKPSLNSTPSSVSSNGTAGGDECATETKGKKPVPALMREAMSFRRSSLMDDSPFFTTYGENNKEVYRPLPIDTTNVELPPRLIRLVDLLSENAHEVWAKGRMDEGWTYGPQRDDKSKKHPCLVPYIFLTDEEKEYDINIAKETLKTLLAMKFTLVDRSSKY
uniref:Ryanodine receptor Ryr domain-containing protein n=1 Tax=Globisporangium ultimum (strain ATCC 200006 / CBS 805.95 / DAOM BR144) TaxID=431595 RepID=K3WG63_GLOUD